MNIAGRIHSQGDFFRAYILCVNGKCPVRRLAELRYGQPQEDVVHCRIAYDTGLVNIVYSYGTPAAALGDEKVQPIEEQFVKLRQLGLVLCVCDSGYHVIAEFCLRVEVGGGRDYPAGFHIDDFDDDSGRANIDGQTQYWAIIRKGKVFFIDIRRDCLAPGESFGEDFMLYESRISRDMNRKIVLNLVLAGKNGLILRQQGYSAFVTGSLPAAGGVEDNTGQSRRLDEICAGMNGNLFAVGLKGYSIVFHLVDRCEGMARSSLWHGHLARPCTSLAGGRVFTDPLCQAASEAN
jgi:hypothetical protein